MKLPLRRWDIAYLAATAVLFIALFRFATPSFPFSYDESDYMTAARKGVIENYRESTSMTLPEFVGTGLKAVHGQLGNSGLSEYIRGRKDLTFYRHYHGPVYYQWLAVMAAGTKANEYWMRASGGLFHILTFLSIYVGMLWIFGETSRPGAVLASMLYIFSVNNIYTTAEISSHVIYIWLSLMALIFVARFAQTASRSWFYAALGACTVALAALEYATLLYISLVVAVLLVRAEFFRDWRGGDYQRWAVRSVALVLGILLVLWPAGLLKGTLLEGFLYIGYLSKFRKGSFGNVTGLDVWKDRLTSWPLDFTFLLSSLLFSWIALWRSNYRRIAITLIIYPTLLFLTTFKNTAGAPRYISSLFAPIYFTAGGLLAERISTGLRKPTFLASAGMFAVLCFTAYRLTVVPAAAPRSPSEVELLIGFVRQHPQQSFSVPPLFLPTLQYYFPETRIRPYPQIWEDNRPDQISQGRRCDFVCSYKEDARITGSRVPLTCVAN